MAYIGCCNQETQRVIGIEILISRIEFSSFYLLWGVRYQHLCDFSHYQKCDNYVITSSNVRKKFQDSNLSEPGQKYPYMPKISPGGLPVSSISSVHINVYIYTYIHFNRVLIVLDGTKFGKLKIENFQFPRIPEARCPELKQTTTARRLLFARDTS